jgi:peptide chain release factor
MKLDIYDATLTERMTRLGLREEDLIEQFTRGSGAGGQKINKTSSTVQLQHVELGIDVRCQRGRSQVSNRYWARMELCDRIEALRDGLKNAEQSAIEKIRRQTRPRPRAIKEKLLQGKHRRSETKARRGKVSGD